MKSISTINPAIRPSQVDSQFIVPTCMCFQEQSKIFIIHYSSLNNHFPGSVYVLAVFTWSGGQME